MKVSELLEVYIRFKKIELRDSRYGKIVAKNWENAKKYGDVTVTSLNVKIKTDKDNYVAYPYLFAYVSYSDIERMKGQ